METTTAASVYTISGMASDFQERGGNKAEYTINNEFVVIFYVASFGYMP
eukprot:COSAG05_NODE_1530_length_4621_cov_3.869084_3_plen_49_part_00